MIVFNYLHYQFISLVDFMAAAAYRSSLILCQYVMLAAEVLPWTN
jgi:hypothetical protein